MFAYFTQTLMKNYAKGLVKAIQSIWAVLQSLLLIFTILKGILLAIRRIFHHRQPPRYKDGCCVHLPPTVYKRADPLLYSQSFLLQQGLAVTWDNPDIQLYKNDKVISSSQLIQNEDYEVRIRIWNNSYDAPAVGLGVYLSYLSFGIGTTSTMVGKTGVNLGVKGGANHPAFASFNWRTPDLPGHYCLQALLEWPDDANPANNLGQENTQVGKLQSPALFSFPVFNDAFVDRRFELEVDFYQFPALEPCPKELPDRQYIRARQKQSRYDESRSRWNQALSEQGVTLYPVPSNWHVVIEPRQFSLGPKQEQIISVTIEPMDPSFLGRQPVNIRGFAYDSVGNRLLAGGVTLYVER